MTLVSDEEIEKAIEFLLAKAPELGRKKAAHIRTEYMVKVTLALQKKQRANEAANVQEREALASQQYLDAIDAHVAAAAAYEAARGVLAAVQTKIEVWRTQQATARYHDEKLFRGPMSNEHRS